MDYRYIGKIVSTRGLKGEVKVLSDTDFKEERYAKNKAVYIQKDGNKIPCFVRSYKVMGGADLLVFEGYEDINLVKDFVGCELYSEGELIRPKNKNEFHIDDLLNVEVFQNEQLMGKVQDVRNYPQGDYLVVLKVDQTTALIPFRDEFVLSVDLNKNRIDIIDLEGLL